METPFNRAWTGWNKAESHSLIYATEGLALEDYLHLALLGYRPSIELPVMLINSKRCSAKGVEANRLRDPLTR